MHKKQFFDAYRRDSGTHHVDGFGEIQIESLTLPQRLKLEDKLRVDQGDALIWVCVWGVPDFEDQDYDDIAGLKPEVVDELAAAILALSGLGERAAAEAKNG